MKQTRKDELLHSFPAVPFDVEIDMHGRGSANFAVMLTSRCDDALFVRCFHRYSDGKIEERQRYVFAKDGAVRYGSDDGMHWAIRSDFREPVFCKSCYGYNFDNSYSILNPRAYKETCMKYSELEHYTGSLPMEYLRLYCKHPNLEYLMKSGYTAVIDDHYTGYWGSHLTMYVSQRINWKSNNLLQMLGLSRIEFKMLRGREHLWEDYIEWRDQYPKCKPEELLYVADKFGWNHGSVAAITDATGLNPFRAARYLTEQNIETRDYLDYIQQCRKLKYDMHDTSISMPHHFMETHTRLSGILADMENATVAGELAKHITERECLEFATDTLLIRQPRSMGEIIMEGKLLHHCVGGYAERHARGKLHIMFIRRKEEPEKPYFTMEVSTSGVIVQVRGLRNCDPPDEVTALVEHYKEYIEPHFKKRKKKVRISA